MSFLVSPGVHVREIDLTNVIPAVQTTIGAIAGAWSKGPIATVTSVSSEEELLEIFGKPMTTSNQFENWFAAANFLQYSDHLKVVRCESGTLNAGANSGILIRDDDHYEASFSTGQGFTVSGLLVLLVLGVIQSAFRFVLLQQDTSKWSIRQIS